MTILSSKYNTPSLRQRCPVTPFSCPLGLFGSPRAVLQLSGLLCLPFVQTVFLQSIAPNHLWRLDAICLRFLGMRRHRSISQYRISMFVVVQMVNLIFGKANEFRMGIPPAPSTTLRVCDADLIDSSATSTDCDLLSNIPSWHI